MATCGGCSLYAGTFLLFLSLLTAHAHRCSDGKSVSCTAVQPPSFDGAPSATRGYAAPGYPMCTPKGSKVFCLVNHDAHHCADGMAPCCDDGSVPSHGHNDYPGDQNADQAIGGSVTCSAVTTTGVAISTVNVTSHTSNEAPDPIILDDMDRALHTEQVGVSYGNYWPCLKDAYKGQFHHDWASNKGGARFTFVFEPPMSGCYKVEEYHPGGHPSCSSYLPTNAIVDVDTGNGTPSTLSINQAENPAQWNEIGAFVFNEGTAGRITMRNSEHETCNDFQCFLMVDAFRLSWLGGTCSHADDVQDSNAAPKQHVAVAGANETEQQNTSDQAALEGKPQHERDHEVGAMHEGSVEVDEHENRSATQSVPGQVPWRDAAPDSPDTKAGSLLIRVVATDGNHDLFATLASHQTAMETTLAAHFGCKAVRVFEIVATGRRLGAGSGHQSFEVSFLARGFVGKPKPGLLKDLLNAVFAVLGANLEFLAASVEWKVPSENSELEGMLFVIIAAGGAVLVLGAAVVVLLVRSVPCRNKKQSPEIPECHESPSELNEADVEKPGPEGSGQHIHVESEQGQSLWEKVSGSTQEPASEDAKSDASQARDNETVDTHNLETESCCAI